jgi:hypothetical protein
MSKTFSYLFLLFSITTFSQNTLVSSGNVFEGEPYLVINPQNQQHLVAAWMGFQLNQKVCIKSAVSMDGGNNWSSPIAQNHEVATNSSADVSLAFNSAGVLFMCYIDYDNDLFTNGQIIIRKSVDGGFNWSTSTEVINIADCPNQLCVDRPWMVIDRSGGIHDGTIYISAMNAKQPAFVTPPFHPYLSVSKNDGFSFETPRYLDSVNYLAGSTIPQVMPSPAVSADGTFYAIYPSYETSQSLFPRYLLANSTTQGLAINHIIAYQGVNIGVQNDLLKRGSLLKTDPSNSLHLAYFFLSEINDGADVYFTETMDAGITWTSFKRINQDPIANGKLQDLLWADFDLDGDLLVCWRDRRNGIGTSYAEPTEIYATVRPKDSLNFNVDYRISSQQIQHDQVLTNSGNDFMHTCLMNDTAYTVWGDVRTGTLKIYLNKWNIFSQVGSLSEIPTAETIPIIPNPSNISIQVPANFIGETYTIFSLNGSCIVKKELENEFIDISCLTKGSYILQINKEKHCFNSKFIKD